MCARLFNASILTGFPFKLPSIFTSGDTEHRTLPEFLIPRLTLLGPLLGTSPYFLISIFDAVSGRDFMFLFFVILVCGFIVGLIPAFFGAVMYDWAMQRVSTPDIGSGLVAGFLCGALGLTVTLATFFSLTTTFGETELKALPQIAGFCILQGGIPGAILGAMEGRKMETED